MTTKLTFRADVNGRPFGVIVVHLGAATARVGRCVLRGVSLPHAMMWIRRHNPVPSQEVHFQLVGRFDGHGDCTEPKRVLEPPRIAALGVNETSGTRH
jgi:hypothetical protein